MPRKRNIYNKEIELRKIHIRNAPRKDFAEKITKIKYRGYEVEDLADGRKILIAKPGGKQVYGTREKKIFYLYL